MRAIAQERRRFGYRRLHVLLKRSSPTKNVGSRIIPPPAIAVERSTFGLFAR
jgi:hypothetical protein